MKIVCDACGAKYSIADEKVAGKVFKIRCKKCSNIIVVRGGASEAAASAPAESAAEPAAPAAAEGEWHIVIDQEQVGPMSVADVRARFARGDIDADSYIWKEGFADWQRIVDVPEFADLQGAAAPAPADQGGLFGGAAAEGDASAGADLFGGGGDAGGNLFGGGGDVGGGDLFGGGAPAAENTGEVAMSAEAEAQLKGQRNENSVLFSLGNLAALASDSKPAPSAASAPAVSNTGGSEGSGLIDIRSMASVYLADKGNAAGPSAGTGSADDLPVFSPTSFESASPVLLPVANSGTDKKVLYALIGVIAVLLMAAVVLVIVVLSGDDDKKPEEKPIALADQGSEAAGQNPAGTAGGTTAPQPGAETTPDPTTETETPDTETETPEDPPTTEPETTEPEETKTEDKDKGRDRDRDKPKGRDRDKPKGRDRDNKRDKPTPPPPVDKGGSCDEVTCLVSPNEPCCRKFKKGGKDSGGSGGSKSNLPDKPSRSDITQGVSKVRGRVTSCGTKTGGKGTVTVKIKISPSGKVSSANAKGGSSALNSCVSKAIKGAKFPKTQKGVSVSYPFVFR